MPLYSLEQMKAAVLRHAYETAKRFTIHHSHEHDLTESMRTPYLHATGDDDRTKAHSFAFVCQRDAPSRSRLDRHHIVTKTPSGELWIDLKQGNMHNVLADLAEGIGMIVIRVWYYYPRFERLDQLYGLRKVDELAVHQNECHEGSSGKGSGAGSSGGSGSGSGVDRNSRGLNLHVRECETCSTFS